MNRIKAAAFLLVAIFAPLLPLFAVPAAEAKPNIDELANESARFSQFYTTGTTCCPED